MGTIFGGGAEECPNCAELDPFGLRIDISQALGRLGTPQQRPPARPPARSLPAV
jgi:hypothetical protein